MTHPFDWSNDNEVDSEYILDRQRKRRRLGEETEQEVEMLTESKKGLWANIHAKRKRIKAGSGERMRKPGEEGAPTPEQLKKSQVKEEGVMPGAANAVATGAVDMNPTGGKTRMKKKPMKRFKDFRTYTSSLETDGIN